MNASSSENPQWISDYQALTERVALVELGHRTQIEVSGADRASFMHNLCTNEVRKLSPGAGREAFITTVQGKILAHVFIFAGEESLLLETVAGEGDTILKHLDHYLVSERVELADRSAVWSELLLAGPDAEGLLVELTGAAPSAARLAHISTHLAGHPVSLRRVDLAGPVGFFVSGRAEDMPGVVAALSAAGAARTGEAALEAARIEWGFPLFGRDIRASNLPQEVARDALAISFTKGCYLGQETIARIDALGHVNKSLVGLRCESPAISAAGAALIPAGGAALVSAGQAVGQVTSAAFSPRLGCPLALGYVRRGHDAPGTRLNGERFDCEVIALPVGQPTRGEVAI